jgi:hypothetical protein
MNLAHRDLFETYRFLLATACTIYALIVTARSLWGWVEYLSSPDRMTSVMRRYAIASLLRIRLRRFTGEFLQIGFWLIVLAALLDLHRTLGFNR